MKLHRPHLILWTLSVLLPLVGCQAEEKESPPLLYWQKDSEKQSLKHLSFLENEHSLQKQAQLLEKFIEKHPNLPASLSPLPLPILKKSLLLLQNIEGNSLEQISKFFTLLKLKNQEGSRVKSLITGYYTPLFAGRKKRDEVFRHPLYRTPKELSRYPKRYTREKIEAGALVGKKLELLWMNSALDAYLIHVQGSATIQFKDGSKVGIAFAGSNKQKYVSLGHLLIQDKKITREDISLPSIRDYFEKHPGELMSYLIQNPRYIFFNEGDGTPRGSMGAPVSAFHSIATERFADRTYRFPPYWPMLLHMPNLTKKANSFIVFNQDTGSAIRGPARMDLYTGVGQEAEDWAGDLKHSGEIYILWPKGEKMPNEIAGLPLR